jgi:hypothetical protein
MGGLDHVPAGGHVSGGPVRLGVAGRLRARYGASPLHLLAMLASFAIAGAAVIGWFDRPHDVMSVLEWFAAAIVLHDVVLWPLYSLLDAIAFGGRRRAARRARPPRTAGALPSPVPYLRIPSLLSGLLLLVFLPVIFGLGSRAEFTASGIPESGYLARWLLAVGAMFAVSGVAYAAAVRRARATASRAGEPGRTPPFPPGSPPGR